jgi:hypothetical protein
MMTGAGAVVAIVAPAWARMHASTASGSAARDDQEDVQIARRAVDLIEQLSRHDWATADFDQTMQAKLPADELASTWQQIVANAGEVTAIGRPTIVGRGLYRVCDVPLVFEHGPMRARVSFNRAGAISGLFVTLPE